MKKLPKKIYVQLEQDGDGGFYLVSSDKVEDLADDKIGIYELKETKTKTTVTMLK